jgi:glycogen debranching enzyme
MPAKIGLAIPSFTFSWVLALGDHVKYRHDAEFMQSLMPALRKIMCKREGELVDGLLPCPRGKRYWQFYDWAKDMSGDLEKALAGEDASSADQFESPLNLFAVLAFEAAADCAAFVGETGDAARWRGTAERMRGAVRSRFWNAEKRQIETRLGASLAPSELVQALALLANAIPEDERAGVVNKLSAPSDWTQTTLSQSLYKYEALRAAGGAAERAMRKSLDETWSVMLDAGATSFWEVSEGWKAFGSAGSLCHGWSAVPVYFYGVYPRSR